MKFLEHGTMIVCGNYEGDLQQICQVLNNWTSNGADDHDEPLKFIVKDGRIGASGFASRSPTTHPFGRLFQFADACRMPEDSTDQAPLADLGKPDAAAQENVELERISMEICPLLTRGTLELVLLGHCKKRQARFAKLAIKATGSVHRDSQTWFSDRRAGWFERSTEKFARQPRQTSGQLSLPF